MKKSLQVAAAVLIAASVGYYVLRPGKGTQVTYERALASRADIEVTISSSAMVKPENKLEIKAPVGGRADKVLVREGQAVKKGAILAWMSSTERAAMLDAASARGAEEVAKWEELYRATPVLAPIDGTIIQRNVEPGQTFTAQDPVFVISNRLTVKAQVDETDLAQIKLDQRAEITLDAFPGERIPAKVRWIAYDSTTINNVTTYTVDILPLERPAHMRSGMSANVTFYTDARTQVVSVPTSAVRTEKGKSFVLVAKNDRQTESRPVRVGLSDGKRSEVLHGLAQDEEVLIPVLKLGESKSESKSAFGGMPRPPRGAR